MINSNVCLKNRTILLVNTGSVKKRFILQKLNKLGLKIIVLNKEKNWAQPYVDHWIIANTFDHSESIKAIEKFIEDNPSIKIEGVITFWEDDVLLTSKIVDRFNFIGIPFSIASQVRNKYLFREFCEDHKITVPRHKLIKSEEDLNEVINNFNFPVVVKPVFGSSSAFVMKVDTKNELIDTVHYVQKNISTSVESSLSDGLGILVEEFIDGDEVDVDILLQNGKIKFSSVSDNFNKLKGSFFVDSGQAIPSSLPIKDQEDLVKQAEELLEKLGIFNGCVHFEGKTTRNGPVPIELNMRMGGDYVYSYIKTAWQVDLIENAVKIALGEFLDIKPLSLPKKYIVGWDLYAEDSGILAELDVDEEINDNSALEEINLSKHIGDRVLVPPEGWESIGWLTVSGDNLLDAQDNLQEILEHINFSVVKFDQDSSLGKTQRRSRFSAAQFKREVSESNDKINHISRNDLRRLHIGIVINSNSYLFEKEEQFELMKQTEEALVSLGYKVSTFDLSDIGVALPRLESSGVNLVLNLCKDINGSSLLEPHAAALLDILKIPYTGSNPYTLSLCIDKIKVKKILTYHNIPIPKWDYAYEIDDKINDELEYPLIVKSANTDYSISISNASVVSNEKELRNQINYVIKELGNPALVEEYIEGDEFDAYVLGNTDDDLRILPLTRYEFDALPKDYWHIFPYDNSYPYNLIKNQLPVKNMNKRVESLLREISLDTYNILDCYDYARVEMRLDKDENPYVIELNPNPLLGKDYSFAKTAAVIGMDYGEFLEEIIRLAVRRYRNKPNYYHFKPSLI